MIVPEMLPCSGPMRYGWVNGHDRAACGTGAASAKDTGPDSGRGGRPRGLLVPVRPCSGGRQAQRPPRQAPRRPRRARPRAVGDPAAHAVTAAPDLEGLATVEVADVYKGGRLAARLRRRPDGVEFAYRPDYLGEGGPAAATTLPLTDEPVHTHAGAVPPFFAGLLPEGRRLSSLRRAVKTSADDELSLLLAVGRDTVGDVQVVPEGVEPAPAEPLVQVGRDWSEVSFADVLAEAGVVDPVGLPGIQDKASARMISVPVGRAGERYLLKVDPPEYPHVVENEAFFLDLARHARIDC